MAGSGKLGLQFRSLRMRAFLHAAVLMAAATALSGCLVASAAGTAVGVTAKAASATVHGAGAVAGAVIP